MRLPSAWSKDDDDDCDDHDTWRIALGLLLRPDRHCRRCARWPVCYTVAACFCAPPAMSVVWIAHFCQGGIRPHEGTAAMTASHLRVSKCGWFRPRRDVSRFGVDCQKLLWRFADERANWWRVAVYRWDTYVAVGGRRSGLMANSRVAGWWRALPVPSPRCSASVRAGRSCCVHRRSKLPQAGRPVHYIIW